MSHVESARPDFDVIVVGSGAAGLCAALSAAQSGATVLVAESEDVIGGSSRLSAGMMMGAATRLQKANGINDTPDSLYHEYLQLNQWEVEPGLAWVLASEAGATIDWLENLGVTYAPTLIYGGDESVPRTHLPLGSGQMVIDVLAAHCRQAGVEFALRRRIDRLVVSHGRVVGVAVGEDELGADAVVLAAGGFGNSPDRLRQLMPDADPDPAWQWYIGADGARGDALDLGQAVGAEVVGQGRGLCLLHANFGPQLEAYLPGWLLLVNRNGARFLDETAPYGIIHGLVAEQGGRVWGILDDAARLAASPDGRPEYKQELPTHAWPQSPTWNSLALEQQAAAGRVERADTVDALAGQLGLPSERLAGTIRRYNQLVDGGDDRDYRKPRKFLKPVATPPFWGVELRLSTVCLTAAGLRIDPDGRVLDVTSTIVPGLYAAGECTGGVLGTRYMGSGNSYANCVTFGRIAGHTAAVESARAR